MFSLLRQRNFSLLWFGGLISMMGDWALMIGLPIYVYQLTGSALATSGAFLAGRLPNLLIGPAAGVFVDRWDRRRTMVVSNVLLALGIAPLLLVRTPETVWIVYLVMFWQSTVAQFFNPAENALLPQLVGEEHLIEANSLNALNNNLARLFGPALGGFAAALAPLYGIVLLDVFSFVLAGILIALITGAYRPESAPAAPKAGVWAQFWHELREGLAHIRRDRRIQVIFGLMAITSIGEGVFSVLFVVFVNQVLQGGALEIGWLMSAQAVGGLLGGVLIGRFGKLIPPYLLIGGGSIVFGLLDLAIFNYPVFFPGFALAIILFVLVGVPGAGAMTGITTMLQTAVGDAYRGRVFAVFGTVTALTGMAGTALAGFLGDRVGVITVLNIQGFGYVLAGAVALLLLRGLTTHQTRAEQTAAVADSF